MDSDSFWQSLDPPIAQFEMDALSPASSSATGYNSMPAFDPLDTANKVQDWNDLFDFDNYDSASSNSQSPNTVSPNRTPSPVPLNGPSPTIAFAASDDFLSNSFTDFGTMDYAVPAKSPAGPAPPLNGEIVVKEEPMEFGFSDPSPSTGAPPSASTPQSTFSFDNVSAEQQAMLQAALSLVLQYQATGGLPQATVEPSMIFNNDASVQGPSVTPATGIVPTPVSVPSVPSVPSVSSVPSATSVAPESDSDALVSIEEHEQTKRETSVVSLDDLDSRIDGLAPLSSIFSAGRGKGGKKGGGMSSVVRGDDEDVDDDDSWRPSPEEYKKLSSKEKRQLRNKLSARAFRNRRKDYIGTLEAHIKDRDTVIDAIKSELVSTRTENQDLKRELAALKAGTMAVIHPESAEQKSMAPAMLTAFSMANAANAQAMAAVPNQPVRRTPTPKINTRKDMPATPSGMGFWGGSNNPLGGGGSTAVHTAFTPEVVLPEGYENTIPRPSFADLPRVNLNPHLTEETPRMASLSSANTKDMNSTFSDWTENNAFSLRNMDSYRIQMWQRLAREAAADKANVPIESRPKFYVESAAYAQAASQHVSSKLASSFWSAFSGSSSGEFDADKLTAVVTGQARLKVVPVKTERDDADALAAALGGLKLQSGLSRSEGHVLRVRENPIGALSSFFHLAGCSAACTRA